MSYFESGATKVQNGNQRLGSLLRLILAMKSLGAVWIVVMLVMLSLSALASHNRAGEIIYKRVDSNPFRYEITIITYTKTGGQSDDADRCSLDLYFGDGEVEEVFRENGPPSANGDCDHMGVQLSGNTKMNIYRTVHVYPGVGRYTVYMQDQNRNAGVKNIPSSDNVWFYIESEIVIDVQSGGNTAPTLLNPPIDNGCINQVYVHNPGAVDPDGDSLSYSIVACKTMGGQTIPGFVQPNLVATASSSLEIDERTGTLRWTTPVLQGEYNIAIRIEEWRYNPFSGDMIYVGSILRDMQIDIKECDNVNPPVIQDQDKVCVQAGSVLRKLIIANDLDGNQLDFTATGFPLLPGEGGTMLPEESFTASPPIEAEFIWNTNCSHVQYEPYWMYFKAKENFDPSEEELVDFEELEIQVVAPPVIITDVSPAGASMNLSWTTSPCEGADGYDVYRYNDSLGYVALNCNTGVPEELGYVKIGRVDGIDNTTFVDDNDGRGLVHGQRYCYMIVATFPDRSESYASLEACGELIRDVPILNKASVVTTDLSAGVDSVAWYKPTELRANIYAPPYKYRLSRATRFDGPYEAVFESDAAGEITQLDTIYVDRDLNTEEEQYFYSIELLSGPEEISVGKSRNASTIYLDGSPADNKLNLRWAVDVPWENAEYILYREKTDSAAVFEELIRTPNRTFTDTGLVNGRSYRYFVRSIGRYSSEQLPDTLINYSQIFTGIPKDLEAPCEPPGQLIEGDCNLDQTVITWNNPNDLCEDVDDVVAYHVYYAPKLGEEMELLEVKNVDDTVFTVLRDESIAGCYFVTAIDSFENESERSHPLCIDNCPTYELPNVFTPGNDGFNDFFGPFPYKYVESIDLTIYNRWGNVIFETKDPDINWDGTNASGDPVPDGTYFYVCTVNEIRLVGIVQRELKGSFTIIRQKDSAPIAK